MKKNFTQRELEYDKYVFSVSEAVVTLLFAAFVELLFSVIFYRSLIAVLFLLPLGIGVWKNEKKKKISKRKRELSAQFRDCIQSVGANLKAGYSVENAFRESITDIKLLYGENSYMAIELVHIIQGMVNNINLEELLLSLGRRSGITDIKEFGEVFAIAKRNGGNMTEILMKTSSVISRKIEIDREIQVLISAKRLEQQIMNLIPFAIIIYISLTSPGFFDVLYHNTLGVCIMTVCLLVYLVAYRISTKIVDICTD